jgi:uroporphyrin-III C-methyltransferase
VGTATSEVDALVVLDACELGQVALVGAGPGDPELLTVKAVERLKTADVVLHDKLIPDEILGLVPLTAKLINVGKRCGDTKDRSLQQSEIHELLLVHSRRGHRVVRLKCGDPLVFGRGGEELEFLSLHGVPTEVVPGITTALGAAASCQMPLTHRGWSNSVRFIVGQTQAHKMPDLSWPELARDIGSQTVVMYMGMKSLGSICERLRENGAAADVPMAVVESATSDCERALYGTIASMPLLAEEHEMGADGPVILFFGPTTKFPIHISALSEAKGHTPCIPLSPKRSRTASPSDEPC